ncbi:uncharacterized protein BT62DRAFT_1014072 [Guyanagaster necrorhizus]|uniref:Uncharacterized protein n=1 Tax=Guyanagaster necrorhizus TaxID=856835 RepID=A0A9P7VEY5_9AGAR|nr:uncharacterized protein BT62DRAFT_1014072 [Guyanagaster necrorhizus MCA 3950]KAG7439332.1 hypothetical protein BT62DRAFT_1014072 [Guyanagaster necrorhizus MCA 3950]
MNFLASSQCFPSLFPLFIPQHGYVVPKSSDNVVVFIPRSALITINYRSFGVPLRQLILGIQVCLHLEMNGFHRLIVPFMETRSVTCPTIMPGPKNNVGRHRRKRRRRCPLNFNADIEAPTITPHKRTASVTLGETEHPPKKRKTNSTVVHFSSGTDNVETGPESSVHDAQEPEPLTERFDLADPNAVDDNGFYEVVKRSALPVLPMNDPIKEPEPEATADVRYFFKDLKDQFPQKRLCRLCKKVFAAHVTKCRQHMAAAHKANYYKYCNSHNFESKLTKDLKRKKNADNLMQTVDRSRLPRASHYLKDGFTRLCLGWGAATDQASNISHCNISMMNQSISS